MIQAAAPSHEQWTSWLRAVHQVNASDAPLSEPVMAPLLGFARAAIESGLLESVIACNFRLAADAFALVYLLKKRGGLEMSHMSLLFERATLAQAFCVEQPSNSELLAHAYHRRMTEMSLDERPLQNAPAWNPWWIVRHNDRDPAPLEFADFAVSAALMGVTPEHSSKNERPSVRVLRDALLCDAVREKKYYEVLVLGSLPRTVVGALASEFRDAAIAGVAQLEPHPVRDVLAALVVAEG